MELQCSEATFPEVLNAEDFAEDCSTGTEEGRRQAARELSTIFSITEKSYLNFFKGSAVSLYIWETDAH